MKRLLLALLVPAIFVAAGCREVNGKDDAAEAILRLLQETVPGTPSKRTYMTTMNKDGNLGGISGADSICDTDPSKPDSDSTWKALLADGTNRVACTTPNCVDSGAGEHTDWVLAPNTTYTNAAGDRVLLTTNAAGVHDFSAGRIDNQLGDGGEPWWSGLNTDWTSAAANCSNWTSTSGNGHIGDGLATDMNALNWPVSNGCNLNFRSVFCIEQ